MKTDVQMIENKNVPHKFVKVSHLVENGQQILFRLDEKFEVVQILERGDDGEWFGVAGWTSGMPVNFDLLELVAKRSPPREDWPDSLKESHKPEVTITLNSLHGPTQIKYEQVEPPDCEAVREFGNDTIHEGYYIVDDEGSHCSDNQLREEGHSVESDGTVHEIA